MSHTYALLRLSKAAYDEIRAKLAAAGYADAFDGATIDMHGLAIVPDEQDQTPVNRGGDR